MVNKELIKKIVNYLEIEPNEVILEAGAGSGNLTKELKGNTIAVEIDEDLVGELEKIKGIEVINKNILECIDEIKFDKLVGNIPYSICEPLLNKLIKIKFKFAILTLPEKFIKKPLIKLVLDEFFDFKILEEVSKECFVPKPKVKSIVIKLVPKEHKIFGEVYLQQDKKLKNALRESFCKYYNLTKKEALKKIPELNFLDKKGFELDGKEWKKIYEIAK